MSDLEKIKTCTVANLIVNGYPTAHIDNNGVLMVEIDRNKNFEKEFKKYRKYLKELGYIGCCGSYGMKYAKED